MTRSPLHNGLFGAATTALHALIRQFQDGTITGPWHSSYIDTTIKGAIVRSILVGISELDPPYHHRPCPSYVRICRAAWLLLRGSPESVDTLIELILFAPASR